MEIVIKRYASLVKALTSLRKSLEIFKRYANNVDLDEELYAMSRDSCIQRFEYSFDAFWKFIKLYLEQYENIDMESNSPRYVFKEAEKVDIFLKYENLDILLEALSDRNLTAHSYNEETAEEIVSHIPLFYETMHTITMQLQSKINGLA